MVYVEHLSQFCSYNFVPWASRILKRKENEREKEEEEANGSHVNEPFCGLILLTL